MSHLWKTPVAGLYCADDSEFKPFLVWKIVSGN